MAKRAEDPVLISARREALVVFATWVIAATYCLVYCSRHAYGRPIEDLQYIAGFPDWVFWGIIVPWGACILFSWIFAAVLMRDEDLGEDPPGAGTADEFGAGGLKMLAATEPAWGTLTALVVFILASMWIGVLANRAMREGSFLKGFFLGNRGLGSWALALTATVQSGGTFMGYPSLVYSYGWSVTLWIASYMVVPITGFAVLGKRLAQISRRCGAITMPDLFRERFGSPALGLVASLFILLYMSFMMVAQFKAGALIMKISWSGTGNWSEDQNAGRYQITEASLARLAGTEISPSVVDSLKPLAGRAYADERQLSEDVHAALKNVKAAAGSIDASKVLRKIASASELTDWPYIVGLTIFTVSVVGYTLIGGFLAAVWTDLFQSVMMWVGVIIFLLLALRSVDALKTA